MYIVIGSKATNVTVSPALQSQSAPRQVATRDLLAQPVTEPANKHQEGSSESWVEGVHTEEH